MVYSTCMGFNPDYVTPPERERRRLAKIKVAKANRTITIPMQHWILLDKIFDKLSLTLETKDIPKSSTTNSDTVRYCIEQIGIEEGIES